MLTAPLSIVDRDEITVNNTNANPVPVTVVSGGGGGSTVNQGTAGTQAWPVLGEVMGRTATMGSLTALTSVAEPPLFWAAPAPGGQGPGADSDLLGSAPAPDKKR